ncbi:hypothetical protein RYX36_032390 [Vicia faba]
MVIDGASSLCYWGSSDGGVMVDVSDVEGGSGLVVDRSGVSLSTFFFCIITKRDNTTTLVSDFNCKLLLLYFLKLIVNCVYIMFYRAEQVLRTIVNEKINF